VKSRRAKKPATGVSASTLGVRTSPKRLADVLGMHNDLAEVGRGVPRGCGSADDDGAKPIKRLSGGAAAVLDQPPLVVHVRAEARGELSSYCRARQRARSWVVSSFGSRRAE
jgi:hypothetical protein